MTLRRAIPGPVVMAIGCVLVGGCTSTPTVSPSATAAQASPSASATINPAATLAASATPGPTAGPTPQVPVVAGRWRSVGDRDVADAQLQDVAWIGDRFVATGLALAGGGVFLSSTDGEHWRSTPSGGRTGNPDAIAPGLKGFVAVGTVDGRTAAWHSTDGRSWTYRLKVFPTTLKGEDEVKVTDVVATESGWLAVGRDDPACQFACGETPLRALAWTSTDAESWTRVPAQASLSKGAMNAVTAFDGGYVAVGQGGGHAAIWTSVDGITWTRLPDDPMFGQPPGSDTTSTVSALGVASGFGVIVVVGMGFGVGPGGAPVVMAWRSTDGRTWSPASVERAAEGQVFGVAATTTGLLATGPSGDSSCLGGIWSSADGKSWACEASNAGFAGFGPYAAAGSPMVDVAVGLTNIGCEAEGACPEGHPGAIWWRPVR